LALTAVAWVPYYQAKLVEKTYDQNTIGNSVSRRIDWPSEDTTALVPNVVNWNTYVTDHRRLTLWCPLRKKATKVKIVLLG